MQASSDPVSLNLDASIYIMSLRYYFKENNHSTFNILPTLWCDQLEKFGGQIDMW